MVVAASAASAGAHAGLVPEHLLQAPTLAGLIGSWAVSRLTGIPLLQPHPESVDGIGLGTKLVEAIGLASALWLISPTGGRRSSATQEVSR